MLIIRLQCRCFSDAVYICMTWPQSNYLKLCLYGAFNKLLKVLRINEVFLCLLFIMPLSLELCIFLKNVLGCISCYKVSKLEVLRCDRRSFIVLFIVTMLFLFSLFLLYMSVCVYICIHTCVCIYKKKISCIS